MSRQTVRWDKRARVYKEGSPYRPAIIQKHASANTQPIMSSSFSCMPFCLGRGEFSPSCCNLLPQTNSSKCRSLEACSTPDLSQLPRKAWENPVKLNASEAWSAGSKHLPSCRFAKRILRIRIKKCNGRCNHHHALPPDITLSEWHNHPCTCEALHDFQFCDWEIPPVVGEMCCDHTITNSVDLNLNHSYQYLSWNSCKPNTIESHSHLADCDTGRYGSLDCRSMAISQVQRNLTQPILPILRSWRAYPCMSGKMIW